METVKWKNHVTLHLFTTVKVTKKIADTQSTPVAYHL